MPKMGIGQTAPSGADPFELHSSIVRAAALCRLTSSNQFESDVHRAVPVEAAPASRIHPGMSVQTHELPADCVRVARPIRPARRAVDDLRVHQSPRAMPQLNHASVARAISCDAADITLATAASANGSLIRHTQ